MTETPNTLNSERKLEIKREIRMSKKVSQEQLRKLMGSKLKKKPTKEPFINKMIIQRK